VGLRQTKPPKIRCSGASLNIISPLQIQNVKWYNTQVMRNWSIDTSRFDKTSDEYEIWQLEQLLNFGLEPGETLDRAKVEKYLPLLDIDIDTRNFLEFILYDKKPAYDKPDSLS
jgi:hypothetical protein